MRSSRKSVYLSVAVGLGLASVQSAQAGYLNMESTTDQAVKYAQEINIETVPSFQADGAGADYSVKVNSGVGASAGSVALYYRLDLTNAKFGSVMPQFNIGASGTVALTTPGTSAVSATSGLLAGSSGVGTVVGGGASGTSAIYNVTANSNGILTTSPVYITFSSGAAIVSAAAVVPAASYSAAPLTITAKGPVKLKYRAFGSLGDANAGTNALYTKELTIIDFAPSFAFNPASKITTSVEALNSFGQFTLANGITNNQVALLGSFSVTTGSATTYLSSGTTVSGMDQVTSATANTLIVKGNFGTMLSLAGSATATTGTGLFIGTSGCTSAMTGYTLTPVFAAGSTTNIDSIKITGITSGGVPATSGYLCYNDAAGTGQSIQDSTYSLQLVTVPLSTNFTAVAYSAADIGAFKRTGTELQASFVASTTVAGSVGGVNRFVFTNTGSTPATLIAARLLDGDNLGTSATPTNATGTALTIPAASTVIPANGNLAIQAADIIPSTVTKRSAVVFTIGASSSNIKGTYQLVLPGSTVQSVTQMVGPAQSSN